MAASTQAPPFKETTTSIIDVSPSTLALARLAVPMPDWHSEPWTSAMSRKHLQQAVQQRSEVTEQMQALRTALDVREANLRQLFASSDVVLLHSLHHTLAGAVSPNGQKPAAKRNGTRSCTHTHPDRYRYVCLCSLAARSDSTKPGAAVNAC